MDIMNLTHGLTHKGIYYAVALFIIIRNLLGEMALGLTHS
jgi:hypothetical protein